MLKKLLPVFLILINFSIFANTQADVFIGTSNSRWMLGPYAARPFGMVQVGPDNQDAVWMGGYEYTKSSVRTFSHIHAWTMGGLGIMPTTADPVYTNPSSDAPFLGANAGYHSRIDKDSEIGRPGYYSAYLIDHQTRAEMTATTRTSFFKFSFDTEKQKKILIDLEIPAEGAYQYKVVDSGFKVVSQYEIEGYAKCKGGLWALWNDWTLHFVIRFDKPLDSFEVYNNGHVSKIEDSFKGKRNIVGIVNFSDIDVLKIQTGISLVDIAGARNNLNEETKGFKWNFESAVNDAANEWNNLLGKIKIEGGTQEDQIKFYTNLYRGYAGKQTWSDVDGRYRDPDEKVQTTSPGTMMYGGDAFWNSYWNLNGLWSIITPEIVDNWVNTQMELFKHTGWTGKGPTGLEYSGIMEGSHELALMVAACQKGIRKDPEYIYTAVKKMVTKEGVYNYLKKCVGNPGLKTYRRYGFMPTSRSTANKTLDYAYDDWCAAQLAMKIGNQEDYNFFLKHSENWRNGFHPETKWATPRKLTGKWISNFDEFSVKHWIEGNSWQYSWYVPHNVPGLVEFKGKELFNTRLEYGFEKSKIHKFAAHALDRTAGQSAEYYINHGNQVNMQAAWLFNFSGKPWLTQKYTREIMNSYYGATPIHGWEGDEDEGQMGSWYVMSAMGLFEMDGGTAVEPMIEIGSPLFSKITISLNQEYYEGKEFVIEVENNSPENIYVQSAFLNGVKLNEPRFPFKELARGGILKLKMGGTPNYEAF
ncbi:MAG: GH92 family glycosyl hydrolase [Spirochaetales bacterium]|nr:GH92 family glycosyl hydrolase [Spirochaetales bacterium]